MANSKAILEQVKKDAARQRILTQVKKDAGLIKPTTETFKAELVVTPKPQPIPQPTVKATGIIPSAMNAYKELQSKSQESPRPYNMASNELSEINRINAGNDRSQAIQKAIPFLTSIAGEVKNNPVTPVKKTVYEIDKANRSPLTVFGETNTHYLIKDSAGQTKEIPKELYTEQAPKLAAINPYPQQMVDNSSKLLEARLQQEQQDNYNSLNPVSRFVQKAIDTGLKGKETPSLGNPVADIGADVLGTVMSFGTPTGGGSSLGGATQQMGQLSTQMLQKSAPGLINKLPRVAQKVLNSNVGQKVLERTVRGAAESVPYNIMQSTGQTNEQALKNTALDVAVGVGLENLFGAGGDIGKKVIDNIKTPKIKPVKKLLPKIEPKPELKPGRSNEALFAFDQKLKPIPDSPVNDLEFTTPDTSKKIVNVKDIKPVTNLNRFEKAYQKVVDNQYSISKFSKEADSEMTKILASNSRNTPGTVSYILKDGLVDKTGKQIDVSFKDIVDKVPRSQEIAFDDYLLNRHNVSRMAENKPVFGEDITADISSKRMAEYEKKYPAFKEVAEQYDSFMQKFMKEWGVNSGLVSEDTWTALKEKYPNYTPTYRDKSGVLGYKGSSTKQSYANVPGILKKATGSDKPIINPLEKTMELVDKTVKAAKYNEVGQSILDDIRKDPEGLRHWAEIVEEPKEALLFDINKTLSEDGIEGIMEKFTEQFDRVFSKNKLNSSDVVRVMENGKPVYLKINDKDFFEAVTGLTTSKPGDLEKVGRFITKPFKNLITQYNPIFAARNLFRDIPTAYINGSEKNPLKFIKNLSDAAVDMKFNNEIFQEYKALGGGESNYLKNNLKKLGKENNPISKFNNFIESIPRYAEYKKTVMDGGNTFEAKMKGLYNANEVTVNFARHGNAVKSFDAWIPYLNPAFQGLDKLARQVKEKPGLTIGKGVVAITIPAVATHILNEGNPHYNDLSNRVKDNYYLIPDYTNKDENGYPKTFIKIPKSREYGVMLASLLERTYRAVVKKEDNSFKGFGNTVATNFLPSFDTILQPAFNLKSNKDFADRTIVPMAMQGRSPRYQYDDQTTEISKFLGDKFNISPKQLDYLIKAYTGVVGQLGLPATTKSTYNGDARKNISKPITTQFTADPLYSNEAVNEFYENKKKLDTANKDYKFTNKEGKYYNESLRKSFSNEADTIADLYDEIREVEKSLMTSGEKQKEIERIRREILEIAKEANKLYNNQ
jgi:hypothetical protein